jgi:LacI family transcriptional regulator
MTLHRRTSTRSWNANKAATITQVAKQAGVSTATVSRVLAEQEGVSEALVVRVHEAVKSLNYQPNRVARNLRRQASQIIGVVISDIQNPFFTSLLRGIEKIIEDAGYTLLLTNTDEDENRERKYLAILRAEGVAGIIIAPCQRDRDAFRDFEDGSLPMILIDRTVPESPLDLVTVNSKLGVFEAVNHLIQLGHTQIGLVSGPEKVSTAFERKAGYLKALIDAGITPNPDFIQYGNFRQEGGYDAMRRVLNLPERPTAVMTANNLMTLGALQVIHEYGLSIPDEMSVVGFDDMAWADSLKPSLTAIMQPTYEMGTTSAQLLLERMRDPQGPTRQVVLQTRLIIRSSSGYSRKIKSSKANSYDQ